MDDRVPIAVTILILSYQRRELLRGAIESALGQQKAGVEVMVVDNASTDGAADMVTQEFPTVRIVRLDENIGTAARNRGVAEAKGDIVVTIDDDVRLDSPLAVQNILDTFETHVSVACVNFKIVDKTGQVSTRDWCHPRDRRRFSDEEFLTTYVLEGAAAFRRSAFQSVGGYWGPLFLGHEGHDLALRLLSRGHDLYYAPRVSVTHLVSEIARPPSRIYYSFTRNSIWVSLRNHRGVALIGSIARDLAMMAVSSARSGHFRAYLKGVWDGVRGAPAAWATREPMDHATYRKLRELEALRPNMLSRIGRHLRERPI